MSLDLTLSLVVEGAQVADAEAAVDAVVNALDLPLKARYAATDYSKFPNAWWATVEMAWMGDDATFAVTDIGRKLGPSGWELDYGYADHASLVWDRRRSGREVLIHPDVMWAHLAATANDRGHESPEFEELVPDPPQVDHGHLELGDSHERR